MSFASNVKKEILDNKIKARNCRIAILSGILLHSTFYVNNEIFLFSNDNLKMIEFIYSLIKDLIKIKNMSIEKKDKSYCIVICDISDIKKLFDVLKFDFSNMDNDFEISREYFDSEKLDLKGSLSKRAFIMGSFLASGSVSHPQKSYHMEIVAKNNEDGKHLIELLSFFDIKAKVVIRKSQPVVYIKDSESIFTALLVLNAPSSLMKLENIRIQKELRNKINRQVNCDASNIVKTANAAASQVEYIKKLIDRVGMEGLSQNLKVVASLRLENPYSSLNELSKLSHLSKSCIHHRLRKIKELSSIID